MYKIYEIYEMYEMYKMYEILVAQKRFQSPPTVSTYNRVNSSALQATTSRGAHRQGCSPLHNGCSLFA